MIPLDYAQQIAYSTKETLMFTYEMSKKFKDSPGIYCECGVAAGAQIIAMAYGAPNKTIYAFDSFEGIALPSNRDNQYPGIKMLSESEQRSLPNPGEQVLESSGATVVSIQSFKEHLENSIGYPNKVYIIAGWFEETVPKMDREDTPIALLRLDGDLYNSTWVCLQHLFPKVIQGGVVIVDDYSLVGCRDACTEYFNLIGYDPSWQFIGEDKSVGYFYK